MTEYVANDDNWMTLPEEACPGCGSKDNRRILVDLDCPRYEMNGQMMSCLGCDNAVRFDCQAPDKDGDLLEGGCGWWFQYPLHSKASTRPAMGQPPAWDYKRYRP